MEILEKCEGKNGLGLATDSTAGKEALLDLMHQCGKIQDGVLLLDWHDVKDLLEGIREEPTDEVVKILFAIADPEEKGYIDTYQFIAKSDTILWGSPARIILVVGGPGSGKGIPSARLIMECNVVHLSLGDLLRKEAKRGTPLSRQVDEIMKSGGLVSSAKMVTLMKKKMKDHPGKWILLDGFPRSQENARDLENLNWHFIWIVMMPL